MVVIISSKVRTVAQCNYTCAAITEWRGVWVVVVVVVVGGGSIWNIFILMCVFVCMCLCNEDLNSEWLHGFLWWGRIIVRLVGMCVCAHPLLDRPIRKPSSKIWEKSPGFKLSFHFLNSPVLLSSVWFSCAFVFLCLFQTAWPVETLDGPPGSVTQTPPWLISAAGGHSADVWPWQAPQSGDTNEPPSRGEEEEEGLLWRWFSKTAETATAAKLSGLGWSWEKILHLHVLCPSVLLIRSSSVCVCVCVWERERVCVCA